MLGPSGLRRIAQLSINKAHYLKSRLAAIGCPPASEQPVLYEFAVRIPGSIADLNRRLLERGFLGGVDLGSLEPEGQGFWQLAVTEKRTRAEMDALVEAVAAWMSP
jgi:glycine dehydrogenase subunit 1